MLRCSKQIHIRNLTQRLFYINLLWIINYALKLIDNTYIN